MTGGHFKVLSCVMWRKKTKRVFRNGMIPSEIKFS